MEHIFKCSSVGPSHVYVTRYYTSFKGENLSALRTTPKLEDHPLVGCPPLLIQYILSYPHPYWKPFLHPQTQYAPRHIDRDPLVGSLYTRVSTCI